MHPEEDDTSRAALRRKVRAQKVAAAIRRRQIILALQALSAGKGPQGPKYCSESQFSWTDHIRRLDEREFKLRYRLDYDAFRKLVEILRPDLTVTVEKMARRAKWGQLVQPETKVAIALRFLAGGCPLDLKLIYSMMFPYPLFMTARGW